MQFEQLPESVLIVIEGLCRLTGIPVDTSTSELHMQILGGIKARYIKIWK